MDFNPLELALNHLLSQRTNGSLESEDPDDPSSAEYLRKKARQKKVEEMQQNISSQTARGTGQPMGGFQMSPQTTQQSGDILSSLLGVFGGMLGG
jgi:hypothetical protein